MADTKDRQEGDKTEQPISLTPTLSETPTTNGPTLLAGEGTADQKEGSDDGGTSTGGSSGAGGNEGGTPMAGNGGDGAEPKLVVVPAEVTLRGGQAQRFTAWVEGNPAATIEWLPSSPQLGTFDEAVGLFTAPSAVSEDASVTVRARAVPGPVVSARVRLAAPSWKGVGAHALGVYVLIVFATTVGLYALWPRSADPAVVHAEDDLRAAETTLARTKDDLGALPMGDENRVALEARQKVLAQQVEERNAALARLRHGDEEEWTESRRLLVLVILMGMLGSFIHMARSYSDFSGNQTLKKSWLWWYLLQPFLGGALAALVYLLLRGGLLTTASAGDLNPFGFAAIAGLVGLFTKQATFKLDEVFNTIFATANGDTKLKDGLRGKSNNRGGEGSGTGQSATTTTEMTTTTTVPGATQ